MEQQQFFNLTPDFSPGFIVLFVKLVFFIILVYLSVLVMNFLRDKFINKVTDTKKGDIFDLLIILNKLFFVSGFGFIIANIIQFLLNQITRNGSAMIWGNGSAMIWDYLAFGIILIFVGIGFKHANKTINNNKIE